MPLRRARACVQGVSKGRVSVPANGALGACRYMLERCAAPRRTRALSDPQRIAEANGGTWSVSMSSLVQRFVKPLMSTNRRAVSKSTNPGDISWADERCWSSSQCAIAGEKGATCSSFRSSAVRRVPVRKLALRLGALALAAEWLDVESMGAAISMGASSARVEGRPCAAGVMLR